MRPNPPSVATVFRMSTDVVLYEVADRIATITMNRPAARNALSSEVLQLLPKLMKKADADDAVDVIILTGTDPAFCAGLDLKELGDTAGNLSGTGADGSKNASGVRGPFPDVKKPLIGAVNGVAITGGFEIALACDFLIASDKARFADTHAKVGMVPGWGLTVKLPRLIGTGRARRMSLTAEMINAQTALDWGLVTEVVAHEQLLIRALEVAESIANNHAGAITAIRSLYDEVAPLGNSEAAYALENQRAREWAKLRAQQIAEQKLSDK